MAFIVGVFLAIIGAVLKYGVTGNLDGIDLETVGVIMMVGGGVLALFGLIFLSMNSYTYEEEVVTKEVPKRTRKKKIVDE